MHDDKLDALWEDERNWSGVGFYKCAEDPRWWVDKRPPGIGWTINIARPGAWLSLLALIVTAVAPALVLSAVGEKSLPWVIPLSIVVPLVWALGIGVWVSVRDSKRERR